MMLGGPARQNHRVTFPGRDKGRRAGYLTLEHGSDLTQIMMETCCDYICEGNKRALEAKLRLIIPGFCCAAALGMVPLNV